MGEKKLVPKRRFREFYTEWNENRLENIASFSKGKGYSRKDIKDKGTELLLYGSLYTSYKTVIDRVETYTKMKPNSVISTGKEVVVPSSGETKEDIARASAISKSGIIIGGDLNVIQPKKELNTVFLALEISNGSSQKELIIRAQGSSVVHLYNDDLKNVLIFYPSLKEQQKIGKFFKVLDERIANQERKIAKVKALKEAYLTEMFPQEGETVPKRRFKGFEGKWESYKLDEIGNILSGIGFPEKEQGGKKGIPFYKISDMNLQSNKIKMNISLNYVTSQQVVDRGWKVIGDNSTIIFAKIGAAIFKNRKRLITHQFLIDNNMMAYSLSNEWDPYFAKIKFDTLDLTLLVQTGALPSLSEKDIKNIVVYIPTYLEQQKIGNFFKNLDNQIRTEESKLKKLKHMKEAYLEEMFV